MRSTFNPRLTIRNYVIVFQPNEEENAVSKFYFKFLIRFLLHKDAQFVMKVHLFSSILINLDLKWEFDMLNIDILILIYKLF